jgi:hypothetical protein
VRIVDVNCVVDLTREMAALPSSNEAWLVHDKSRHGDPREHDSALLKACHAQGSQFRAQLVLVPPSMSDSMERRSAATSPEGCRIIRLCPGPLGHGYPLVDWVLSPLPESCERDNLALAIDYQETDIPWVDVVGFARSFPAVPMILIGAAVGEDRALAAALDVAPNLIIELSGLRASLGFRPLLEQFGAHRFVYGSGGRRPEDLITRQLDPSALAAVFAGTADAIGSGAWRESHL